MKQSKKYAKAIVALDRWKKEQIKKGLDFEPTYSIKKEQFKKRYLQKDRKQYD
ncbi:MAG: hypothetical protein ACRCUM_02385 [Mycoplasmoidaceae bacterium]